MSVLVPGSGAAPTRARSAAVRRLFSFGRTTSPPSDTSGVACGSLPPIRRAVSTARKKRLEYDFPIGTAAALKTLAERPGIGAPLVVQLALLGDVVEVQRIRIRLVGVRGPVTDDDHVAARAESLEDLLGRQRLAEGGADEQRHHDQTRERMLHRFPP